VSLLVSAIWFVLLDWGARGDAHGLHLDVAELRSQSASATLIAEQAQAGFITTIFRREQALQLAQQVESTRKSVGKRAPGTALRAARQRALTLAEGLHAELQALAADGSRPITADVLRGAELTRELMTLERTLHD